jgi:GTPase
VGFIQRLPTALIAAFKATLEEINDADLLIHVVDATHHNRREQVQAVGQTLDELSVDEKPVVTALNKIDKLPAAEAAALDVHDYPHTAMISAAHKRGLDQLLLEVQHVLEESEDRVQLQVRIPYDAGELVQLFHQRGVVESEQYVPEGTELRGTLPRRYASVFDRYTLARTA